MPENTRPANTLLTAGVLVIALAAVFVAGATLQEEADASPSTTINSATQPTGIVTTGSGSVEGKPDQLRFSVSVTNTRDATDDALAATNTDVRAITAAVRQTGVDRQDIRTTGLSLKPAYDYVGSTRRITGYTATTRINVLVRKLQGSGKSITAAAEAAGNAASVGGIQLQISNQAALVKRAREKAVADAKAAAQALAGAAGQKVGQLVYVEEGAPGGGAYDSRGYSPQDGLLRSMADLSTKYLNTVPITPGRQKLAVTVQVRWTVE